MKSLILLPLFVVLFIAKAFSQNPPVAIDDTFQPVIVIYSDTIIEFNVINNDFDPDSDPIKIRDVIVNGAGPYLEFDDTRISVAFNQMSDYAAKVFRYRICKTGDTTSVSNWAYLKINAAMSINAPLAVSDTTATIPGYCAYVNILKNDSDPNGDSIIIIPENLELLNDSTIRFTITPDYFSYSNIAKEYLKFTYIFKFRYR